MKINPTPDIYREAVSQILDKRPYPNRVVNIYFLDSMPTARPGEEAVFNDYIVKKPDGTFDFTSMSIDQRRQFQAAVKSITDVTGLTVNFPTTGTPGYGDIRVGIAKTKNLNGSATGGVQLHSYYPDGRAMLNDIYIAESASNAYGFGQRGYYTILHELGHALGLKHLSEASDGTSTAGDSQSVSVMSYAPLLNGNVNANPQKSPQTPMILDILALQEMYGKNSALIADDTTYKFHPNPLSPGQQDSSVANEDKSIYAGQLRTIWDGGKIDTFDLKDYGSAVYVDLRPGYLSSIGGVKNIAIAFDSTIENVNGGASHDFIIGNDSDNIFTGNSGFDSLAGGEGFDTYVFDGDWGTDFVADSDGIGQIKAKNTALTGGKSIGKNLWESEDKQWRYALSDIDDLIISHATDPGRIVITDWSKMKAAGAANPLGLVLPGADGVQPPAHDPDRYALQGGIFVAGRPPLPGGTWQLQSDGSVPGAQAISDANDVMQGGHDDRPGLFSRPTGAALNEDGGQELTTAYTSAVSFWGLGGNDFMSGEHYDDYLNGGDGDDLVFAGAGNDTIDGGGGNDIIVANMSAVHLTTAQHNPTPSGYTQIANNVVSYYGGETNYQGRWYVEKSEDGSQLRIPFAYVKNPDASYTYWPEEQEDRDIIDAGDGDDYVWAGRGEDYIIGGAGADHIAGLGGHDVILGGSGKDLIYGDDWASMQLLAAYDQQQNGGVYVGQNLPFDEPLKLPALHGDDVIDGGADDDEIWGDGGSDVLFGSNGNDQLFGDGFIEDLPIAFHGNDKLDGGDGDDLLVGFGKDDLLIGGAGNDELQGDSSMLSGELHGSDFLDGGEGNDMLFGGGGNDTLNGGDGDDQLNGDYETGLNGSFHGNDVLDGGKGSDSIRGEGGSDTIYGGEGNDFIEADGEVAGLAANFHGNDFVDGGAGNDQIAGGGGNDILQGGDGDDFLAGEDEIEVTSVSVLTGEDTIFGGAGSDQLVGGNGDDKLSGEADNDWLYGGAGNDVLDGGTGRNVLKGGGGNDTYQVTSAGEQIISDAEGNNLVNGVDGLAATTTLDGDLVLQGSDRTVVLKGALTGGFTGKIAVGAEQLSVQEFMATQTTVPLNLVGNTENQTLAGGRGEDEIRVNGRNSTVSGGKGADRISINAVGVTLLLNRGDGGDSVALETSPAPGLANTNMVNLKFGAGVTAADVSVEIDQAANLLKVRYSPDPDDVVQIKYSGLLPASVVEFPPVGEMRLSDGTLLSSYVAPRIVDEDVAFEYVIPAEIFALLGTEVSLSAKLADGSALPAWLQFDAATRKFSGTPQNADVGSLNLKVVGTKDQQPASNFTFTLVVKNVNDAPKAGPANPDQQFNESKPWTYDLPEGTFTDVDAGDKLIFSAKLSNGQPIPSWLKIDAATGRLSSTWAEATHLSLSITATDQSGVSVSQVLDLYVKSSIEDDFINGVVGTPNNDTLVGTSGNEVLVGGLGDDTLDGGAGYDELIGGNRHASSTNPTGTGTDIYLFGRGSGSDVISNGWTGDGDVLRFKSGVNPEDIIVSRADKGSMQEPGGTTRAMPSSLVLQIKGTTDIVTILNFHAAQGPGRGRIDSIQFTDHPGVVWDADTVSRLALQGSSLANEVYGYTTNDVLRGNGGNDTLYGYRGDDAFHFGKDDDTDAIYEFYNEGTDRVVFDQGIRPADVVLIKSMEMQNVYPTGILVLKVTTGSTEILVLNFFQGDAGIESVEFADGTVWNRDYMLANLQGAAGEVNHFVGTPGNDEYVVDNPGDTINEAVGGGIDNVQSSVTYVLPDNVENLTLTGFALANATGNAQDNHIVGNSYNNILDSGSGGLDTLQGGLGNDTYKVFAPSEDFHYFSSNYADGEVKAIINESANGGVDTLMTNAFYAKLPDNVENLLGMPYVTVHISSESMQPALAMYIGNALDNVIDLSAINMYTFPAELDGGAGNDTLIGTIGGQDMASYRTATSGVNVSLRITGAQNTGGSGMDTFKQIEGLVGSQFNDVLTGSEADNVLNGVDGADTMVGGGGNDTYHVDSANDVVVEEADGGGDIVNVKGLANYTLAQNIETLNVTLTADPSFSITGNDSDNSINLIRTTFDSRTGVVRGMGGSDYLVATFRGVELDGGSGDDYLTAFRSGPTVLIGGTGDDVYTTYGEGKGAVIRANAVAVPAEINMLRMKEITKANLRFKRRGEDLVIPETSYSDALMIEKFFNVQGGPGEFSPVQVIQLDDGSVLEFGDITALISESRPPVLQHPIEPFEVEDGSRFSWQVSQDTFADDGFIASYSATMEDGSPLPSWLTFETSTISGTAGAAGGGTFRIKITATDDEGLSTSGILELVVVVEDKVITGTSGNNTLRGGGGNDTISGLDGRDQILGAGGNDLLLGGAGDDTLQGQDGMDTLVGGLGNDTLNGGAGDDTFEFSQGDGQDTLDAIDAKTAVDKLLIHGWTPSQIQLVRSGNHLQVRMGGGTTDQVTLSNYFAADSTPSGVLSNSKIDQIVFDNGEIWDQIKIDTVLAMPVPPPGSYTYAYTMPTANTDYTVTGNAPYNFKGNAKANKLTGNDGANVINGAAGNDTLTGGKGGDTYFMEAGTGQDTIVENDSTAGAIDLLQWGSSIRHDQIWLVKSGNNLEVSSIGTSDKAIVKDWYLGTAQHVEQIWANGKVLTDTKVQALVDAMAAFSPPAAGQTTLSASYQAALNPVIAANWN